MDDWCGDHCTIVLKEYKKDLDKWSLFHRWEYYFFCIGNEINYPKPNLKFSLKPQQVFFFHRAS